MKREELEVYWDAHGKFWYYKEREADSVIDAMEKDYEANRKLWEAEIASLKKRVKELEEENGNLVQFEKSEKIRTDNVTEYRKVRIKVLEARIKELEYVCNSRLEEVNRFRDLLREDEERIKELEADKFRQENYCESLVNENKRLNEIIISKDMVGAVLVNENKALRHNLEDWKCENKALKQRIKELEANQPNEYKEEKYFYTRLVNWLDKNEKGRVNPHHESGCPAIFKELTTKAQNEWKELADKLPKAPKSED